MGALLRMFRYLKSSAGVLAVAMLFLLAGTGLNLAQPLLVQRAVDGGITAGDLRTVVLGAAGIFLAALAGSGLALASGVFVIRAGQRMAYEVRGDLFRKVLGFSFANMDRFRTGQLMVRLNSDVNTLRLFVRMGLMMIVQSVVMLGGSLVFMFRTDARLATILAVLLPSTLVLFFGLATVIRPLFMKVRQRLDELNNVLQENLAGAKVVRAFARQEHEAARFDERNRAFLALSLRVGTAISVLFPLLSFIGQLAILLTVWAGGQEVIRGLLLPPSGQPAYGALTLGQLLAFNNYAILTMWPILALAMVLNFVSMAQASAVRIEEVLAERPTVREAPGAETVARFAGAVSFRGVSFVFGGDHGGGEPVLDGIDLEIRAGEKLGLLGATGSGKSSLVHLVPRFYDPTAGEVRIDGRDVRTLALASLRTRVALVLQETLLLSGTIRENVLFGRPDATAEQLERAADIACAREFIEAKAQGWDEPVGERGAGLSGGQRQRLAIARAVLADPDILILDDATSSVDARTERQIVANLYAAFHDRTVLIISQKINPLQLADRIVLLESGRIAAEGTHGRLVESSEIYRRIFESQSAELRV